MRIQRIISSFKKAMKQKRQMQMDIEFRLKQHKMATLLALTIIFYGNSKI